MTGIVLRGFLAEGLLTENEAILLDQVRQLPAVQPVPVPNGDHSGAAFWTCVTGAQPRPSAELISAPDGSPAEQSAVSLRWRSRCRGAYRPTVRFTSNRAMSGRRWPRRSIVGLPARPPAAGIDDEHSFTLMSVSKTCCGPTSQPSSVRALVDSGAINLCVPAEIAAQLDLRTRQKRLAGMADGSTVEVDMVAPVTVSFENRETTTTAMVIRRRGAARRDPDAGFGRADRPAQRTPPSCRPTVPNFALSKVK